MAGAVVSRRVADPGEGGRAVGAVTPSARGGRSGSGRVGIVETIGLCVGALAAVVALATERYTLRGRTLSAAAKAPRVTIGQAAEGAAVTLVGTVRFERRSVEAPLSGRRCCYFVMDPGDTQQDRGLVDHPQAPRLPNERRGCPFVLDDGTGLALVRVDARTMTSLDDDALATGPSEERARAMLAQRGIERGYDEWRPTEWALVEGDVIAVYGLVRERPEADFAAERHEGYRSRVRRVVVEAPAGLRLLLSNRDELTKRG
ncbi:MAG: hypothetical protein JWM10_1619 [Myxococcaceae bacterium]|nr:hypothetical protein [Myxococcaceae bacterium]